MPSARSEEDDATAAYREHRRALYRYLYWLTGDPSRAEDVAQETFLRFVESRGAKRDAHAWLFTVATRIVRDEARRTRRRRELESAHELVPPGPPLPDEEWERRRRIRRVRRALERLRPRDRQVLLLREKGFSHEEIAEAVGVAPASVGKLAARALDKLREAYDELDGIEEAGDGPDRVGGQSGRPPR